MAPTLAQDSGVGTEVQDTVQEKEPSIRVGHGDKGFEVGTSDGNYLMQLQFRFQFRYVYPRDSDPVTFDDFSDPDQHVFKVNRARFKVGGNVFQPSLKYYMEYELAAAALLDFRFMLEALPALRFKAGQWKAHYNRERVISSGNQQMMERSIITRPFTIDRQQGASLYGRLKGSGVADFNYWASVFTGMGRGAGANDDAQMMWMLRGQWNFLGRQVSFSGSDLEHRLEPRGLLALAAVTNQSPFTRFSTEGGGQLDGFEPGEPGQYRVNQWMQETAFKYRGFAWQQEFHWKRVKDNTNLTTTTLIGTYLQAGYFFHYVWPVIPKPLELAVRYAYYDPNVDTPDDPHREYSLTVNWFFSRHLNKLSSDVTYFTFEEPGSGEREGWRFRLQWDIST